MDDPSRKTDQIRELFNNASKFMEELMEENQRLRRDLGKVEAENREFADRYVQVEEHSDLLQNLYVASHRLHATLEPTVVLSTIQEIVINLVGADRFGVWILDETEDAKGVLSLLAQEGLDENAVLTPEEQEIATTVLASGNAWYADKPGTPLAVVPLRVDGRPVGLLVIRGILSHKSHLGSMDQQILDLLSGQAATALASARLYAEKSRKLETMKAFLDFIKKG